MKTLFVPYKILLIAATILCCGISLAQELSTKGTKIILVVHDESDVVEHIELLVNFQKIKKEQLLKKYGQHKFFLGELKGTYFPDENGILLGNETTVIIFTDKQFSPSKHFYREDHLNPGDEFKLGESQGKVIANKKGELIIKTQRK